MNKAVNIFSMLALVSFTFIGTVIIFDLGISNFHLKDMPYKYEVQTGLSIIVFLVGLLRMKARWQGIKDMKAFDQFTFQSKVSKPFIKRSVLYTSLEVLFFLAALALFIRLSFLDFNLMIVMMGVLGFLVFEGFIFIVLLMARGKGFRVGVNDKVIAYFSREMKIFYYEGLQRVELHQSDLISFKYKNDLVLFMPTAVVADEDKLKFKEAIITQLDEKNIYFDDGFRNWK